VHGLNDQPSSASQRELESAEQFPSTIIQQRKVGDNRVKWQPEKGRVRNYVVVARHDEGAASQCLRGLDERQGSVYTGHLDVMRSKDPSQPTFAASDIEDAARS
jgi:hypothetical protein